MKFRIEIPEDLRARFGKDFSDVTSITIESPYVTEVEWGTYEMRINNVQFRKKLRKENERKTTEIRLSSNK